jgi:hypothetical protein
MSEEIKVSIFASAVRFPFYPGFMESLKGTSVPYEVVFAGPNTREMIADLFTKYPEFRYVHTGNLKPAQCYEIARRACVGETILWAADDCEFSPDLIGKVYRAWKDMNSELAIMSIQTLENGMFVNMKVHSFFGGRFDTPIMAPLGLMSRKVMDELGGFDRRYVCGQYENDAVMRVIAKGGRVYVWGDRENCITIDHYRRHGIKRPFALGYNHDREILEKSWTNGAGKVMTELQVPFEPYEDKDLLTKSQSFNNTFWE